MIPQTAQTINNWFSMSQTEVGISPGSMGPAPAFRDALDMARLAWRQEPSGHYPDGYLGTVGNRRMDRLRSAVWRNQRPYDRGVHKDSRLDMSDYLWPEEFNLMSGVTNQTTGQRYVSPAYAIEPVVLVNRGKPGPRDYHGMNGRPNTGVPVQPDPERIRDKMRQLPPWR